MIKYQVYYKYDYDDNHYLWTSYVDINQAYLNVDYLCGIETERSYWIEEIIINSIDNENLINLTLNNPFDTYNNCVIENCTIINGSFFSCIMDQNKIDIEFDKQSIKWK